MIGIFIIIWLLSFVATVLVFINKGIPYTLANFVLALIPVLNTIIVIKSILFNNIFKEMKDTLKIIFVNHKNK